MILLQFYDRECICLLLYSEVTEH